MNSQCDGRRSLVSRQITQITAISRPLREAFSRVVFPQTKSKLLFEKLICYELTKKLEAIGHSKLGSYPAEFLQLRDYHAAVKIP